MGAQVGSANLPLGKCPLRLRGSGNAAAKAEARLKRLLGVGLRPLFGSKASVLGADLPDPPARSFGAIEWATASLGSAFAGGHSPAAVESPEMIALPYRSLLSLLCR